MSATWIVGVLSLGLVGAGQDDASSGRLELATRGATSAPSEPSETSATSEPTEPSASSDGGSTPGAPEVVVNDAAGPVPPPPPEAGPVASPQADPDAPYGIPSRAKDRKPGQSDPRPVKSPPSEDAIARTTDVQLGAKGKRKPRRPPGSPQRFALEFKIGPYLPDVDRNYDGPGLGPYATIFGRTDDGGVATDEPKLGVMPLVAFEWQFLYAAGPLGVGTQVGFFRDRAQALLTQPEPGENVRSEADGVSFAMVPLSLLLVYRFELLANSLSVPLVPYAKGGLAYSFWWTKDGNGDIARNSDGAKGRGGVVGWQGNAGLMLQLDFLERGVAKTLDRATGINHTYIFGEFQFSRINNFGIGDSIALGDLTGFGGLAIEF